MKAFFISFLLVFLNFALNNALATECKFKRIGKPPCQKAMEALEHLGYIETLEQVKLTQKGEQNYVSNFIELLQKDDRYMVIQGALAIEATVEESLEALDIIIDILSQDDWRATIMLDILINFGPHAAKALNVVQKYLDHQNFHLQYWACRVIGAVGPDAKYLVPKLVEKYKNGVLSVRRNAALALGKIGSAIGNDVLNLLIQGLDDTIYYQIRSTSAIALGTLGTFAKIAIPKLIDSFNNPNKSIEFESAIAIWRINNDISYIIKLMEDKYSYQLESNWEDYAPIFAKFNEKQAQQVIPIVLQNLLHSKDDLRQIIGLYVIGEMSKFALDALTDIQTIAKSTTNLKIKKLATEIAQEIQEYQKNN